MTDSRKRLSKNAKIRGASLTSVKAGWFGKREKLTHAKNTNNKEHLYINSRNHNINTIFYFPQSQTFCFPASSLCYLLHNTAFNCYLSLCAQQSENCTTTKKHFISNPAGSINEALLFCHIKSITGTQLSYQARKLSPYLSIPPSVILQQEGADNAIIYDAEPIINAVSFGWWQHTLECMISLIPLVFYALLLTPACWKSSNRKRTFSCFGPHIRNSFPQDTAPPCHLLKPNWKPSSSHSISTPIKNTTLFCACVCVCVAILCRT